MNRVWIGLALTFALAACKSTEQPAAKTAAPAKAHWTYTGAPGPAHWGELDPAWYFAPWERYAVRLAAEVLIENVAG